MSENQESPLPSASSSPLAEMLRKALLLLVFAVFPIVVILVAMRQVERLEVEKAMQIQRDHHDKILSRLKPCDDDSRMMGRSINRMFQFMDTHPREKRPAYYRRLMRTFPGAIDLFCFDHEGKLCSDLSSQRSQRSGKRSLEIAFQSLCEQYDGKKISPDKEKMLITLFNASSVGPLGAAHGRAILLARRSRDSFFIWGHHDSPQPGKMKGFMATIHMGSMIKDRSLMNGINLVNRRLKSSQVGFLELEGKTPHFYPPYLETRPEIRSRVLEAIAGYNQRFDGPGVCGSMIARTELGFLLAISPRPTFFHPVFSGGMNLLCLAWFFLVFFKIPASDQGIAARIPTKLMALFLFAIGTPALLLLVGGYYALKDHSNVLLQNLERQIKEKLHEFDDRAPLDISRIEVFLRNIVIQARRCKTPGQRLKVYQKFLREKSIDTVMVTNQAGQDIFNFPAYRKAMRESPMMRKKSQFGIVIAQEVIKRLNKSSKIDAGTMLVEVTSGVLNSLIGESGVFDFDQFINEQGKFTTIGFAGEGTFIYLEPVNNTEGMVEEVILAFMSSIKFECGFLQRGMPSLLRLPDLQWKVGAIGDWTGEKMFDRSDYKQHIFPPNMNMDMVLKLQKEIFVTHSSVRKIVQNHNEEELWYGTRGQNISKYTFVAVTSLEPMKKHIQQLWFLLIGIAIMFFLSTLVIGLLLSEQFLKPIASLSTGIKAIEQRRFNFRVPVYAPDELGEMASLMNQVTEGMKDLEVARIVQESLFPQDALNLGNYRIFGKSRAMCDIGGDYFDYFPIGTTKIVGLVGDVSGHGVSAALIMGMAKCAFTSEASHERGPVENLDEFNRFMLKTIKKKKMMTMFFYTLDADTHILHYSNAGHNSPIFWCAAKRTAEFLSMESFPLGVRQKNTYKLQELTMAPGDALLLYTDGLIEAFNKAGKVLDYPRAQEWFAAAAGLDPEEIVANLFSRYEAFSIGCPPNDDVSMICLKRLS